MRIQTVVAVLLAAPAVLAAQGASTQGVDMSGVDMSIGVRAGTLGVGVEANKLISSHVGARVGFNVFSKNTTREEDDLSFDAKVKLHSFTALLDVYPSARGSFHLTGGIITNPLEFTGVGVPTGSGYEIDGTTYTAAQVGTLNASGEFPSVLPYVGLGFGTPANSHKGVKFVVDLGVGIGQAHAQSHGNQSHEQRAARGTRGKSAHQDAGRHPEVSQGVSVGHAWTGIRVLSC